jgi:branched-chain amino acid transport system ATP-binding protein
MSAPPPLLSLRQLSTGYGARAVVHDVDLDVYQGEVVALIGSNGAGKSTLLRCLSGLIPAYSGQLSLDGVSLLGAPSHKIVARGLIQVPEGRQVFAHLTVAENLAMGAYRTAAFATHKQRREAILARFPRLAERQSQFAGLMSGGEQQMLALARALMADPKILLLDEPSMGLAPLFVDEIFSLLAALKAEGRTILLVEQNASAALALADRAYVLEQGRISAEGPAAELAHDPHIMSAYLGHAP